MMAKPATNIVKPASDGKTCSEWVKPANDVETCH